MLDDRTNEKPAKSGERQARRQLMEELFYDFNCSRGKIYWINFNRGLCFGLGTILGGTLVVAFLIWLLSQFVSIPVIGEFVHQIILAIQNAK